MGRDGSPSAAEAWWARIAARSPSANRPAAAAWPSARSTPAAPCSAASCTAWAILARTRVAPAAAASASHSPAPSPMPRNRASAWVRGFGVRFSAPGGAGG